jgi:hypothetical protein
MSITREQAATWFETMHPPGPAAREMYRMAAKALRPVSREQVERVWRGEWIDCSNGWMCSRCEHDNTYAKPFCPSCGAAMTDEAVEMVMERMEKLHEDNGCS